MLAGGRRARARRGDDDCEAARHGDGAELAKGLQDFVKQRITPYKYPRRIEFLAELPKTAAGKLLRYKLREMSRGAAGPQGSHS
jgi:acyl-coenzyme A synthetase/AMP-(fatty) acid ligase